MSLNNITVNPFPKFDDEKSQSSSQLTPLTMLGTGQKTQFSNKEDFLPPETQLSEVTKDKRNSFEKMINDGLSEDR